MIMSYQDLKVLDELRKNSAITEEEYQREKQKIFDRIDSNREKKLFFGLKENSYIALMHMSLLVAYIGIGFVIPLVLWLINRENSKKIDAQGIGIINFMLTWLIYSVIAVFLSVFLIKPLLFILLVVLELILVIIATIKTNKGESWKYPLTITFLR
jgi:uncharacterized Tic20 family protein